MLQIFSVKRLALPFQRGCDDEGVVPPYAMLPSDSQRLDVECRRGVHREHRAKHSSQILFCLGHIHWFYETAQGNIEELLYYLVAYDSLPGVSRLSNQLCGLLGFGGRLGVESVGKDICIQKESTAHSSRPACKDPPSARV